MGCNARGACAKAPIGPRYGQVSEPGTYRERLRLPWWWWAIAVFLVASAVVAVGAFLGPWWGLGAAVMALAAAGLALAPWELTEISADAQLLKAGGAVIDWRFVDEAIALDPDQARRRLGAEMNPADWLLVRPYLSQAVEVRLRDPADPHPAWILSTRDPERLARVVNQRALSARDQASTPD